MDHKYTRALNVGDLPVWACEGCGEDQPNHDRLQRAELVSALAESQYCSCSDDGYAYRSRYSPSCPRHSMIDFDALIAIFEARS